MVEKYEYTPLVTIYIPTHNRSSLLKKAIYSVLAQDYTNIEVIICSDGCTDNTDEVVLDIQSKDKRVIYLKNIIPEGACAARNKCIYAANGTYITGLDDDDEFTPDRISTFVSAIQHDRDLILSTRYLLKDESGVKPDNCKPGEIYFDMMKNSNLVGNQLFLKTDFMKQLGGFDEQFPAWQDYEFWLRIHQNHQKSLKLNNATYILFIEKNRARITTGSKAYTGYKMFVQKHYNILNKKNIRNLAIADIVNRGDSVNFKFLIKYFSVRTAWHFFKSQIRRYK